MENLHNNFEHTSPQGESPLEKLYQEKHQHIQDINGLEKKLGYETKRMMYMIANRGDKTQEEILSGLNQIENQFKSEPEVLELQNKINEIDSQINEIENQNKIEKEEAFPLEKEQRIEEINKIRNKYQKEYDLLDAKSKEFEEIINEKIKPGLDLSMTREVAINTYLDDESRNYPYYIDEITRINDVLGEAVLNLEITIEKVQELDVQDMSTLDSESSTFGDIYHVKNESFQEQLSRLKNELNIIQ